MKNELHPRSVREAANELGLSAATIRSWVRKRRIGYVRLGRAVRIPASEIRRLLEQGMVPAVLRGFHNV
jgi:excisionase family DNA binding protein